MNYKKPRKRRSLNSELKDYYAIGRALRAESKRTTMFQACDECGNHSQQFRCNDCFGLYCAICIKPDNHRPCNEVKDDDHPRT